MAWVAAPILNEWDVYEEGLRPKNCIMIYNLFEKNVEGISCPLCNLNNGPAVCKLIAKYFLSAKTGQLCESSLLNGKDSSVTEWVLIVELAILVLP